MRASTSPYITSSTPLSLKDLKVSSLTNHQQRCWCQDVLQQIFNDNDQINVFALPLMNNEVHDKIIWRLNANNEYNVKSAYHHLLEIIVQNDHLKVVGNSNLVWKLQVPPKVKYFLWCVLRNCLPIHVRLQTKGVMCHSTCYYYDNFENDFTFSSVVEMPKTHGKLLALEFN